MPGGNAWTYTFLLASLRLRAIATAFFLAPLAGADPRERLLRDGTLIQAFAMVAAGFAPNVWAAMPAMMLAGAAWLAVVNTLTVSSQLSLPDWVRARGMSLYMMTMMAATSVSAAVWGQVASLIDVPLDIRCRWRGPGSHCGYWQSACTLSPSEQLDLTPARILQGAGACVSGRASNGSRHGDGRLRIDPSRAADFASVMREARANRLQMGALSWGLFHDTSEPGHYIEYSSTNRGLIICGASIALLPLTPICASGATHFTSATSRQR